MYKIETTSFDWPHQDIALEDIDRYKFGQRYVPFSNRTEVSDD